MGFYEDDRIRRKNKLANKSWDTYEQLAAQGLSPLDIINHCRTKSASDSSRNELYSAVIRIAERRLSEAAK